MLAKNSFQVSVFANKSVDRVVPSDENGASFAEGFPSGQRDQTVNLTA